MRNTRPQGVILETRSSSRIVAKPETATYADVWEAEWGHIQASRLIPAPANEVYDWLVNPSHLTEWLAGHIDVDFPTAIPPLKEQSEFEVLLTRYGLSARVVVRVDEMVPGVRMSYRQVAGVFRSWSHTHLLSVHDKNSTLVTDLVDFHLPLGIVGALLDDLWVRREIESALQYRLARIEEHARRAAHK